MNFGGSQVHLQGCNLTYDLRRKSNVSALAQRVCLAGAVKQPKRFRIVGLRGGNERAELRRAHREDVQVSTFRLDRKPRRFGKVTLRPMGDTTIVCELGPNRSVHVLRICEHCRSAQERQTAVDIMAYGDRVAVQHTRRA